MLRFSIRRSVSRRLADFPSRPTAAEFESFMPVLLARNSWECEPPSVVVRILSTLAAENFLVGDMTSVVSSTIVSIAPTLTMDEAASLVSSMQKLKIRLPRQNESLSASQVAVMNLDSCLLFLQNLGSLQVTGETTERVCQRVESLLRRSSEPTQRVEEVLRICCTRTFDSSTLLRACFHVLHSRMSNLTLEQICAALIMIDKLANPPLLLLVSLKRRLQNFVASDSHLQLESSLLVQVLSIQSPLECRRELILVFGNSLRMSDLELDEALVLATRIWEGRDQRVMDSLSARLYLEVGRLSLVQSGGLFESLTKSTLHGLIVSLDLVCKLKQHFYTTFPNESDHPNAMTFFDSFVQLCCDDSLAPFTEDDRLQLIKIQKEILKCFRCVDSRQLEVTVHRLRSLNSLYLPFSDQ